MALAISTAVSHRERPCCGCSKQFEPSPLGPLPEGGAQDEDDDDDDDEDSDDED